VRSVHAFVHLRSLTLNSMEATWSPFSKADDERLLKEVQSRLAANLAGAEKARLWIEVGRVHERRNDSSGARQAYLKSIEADSRTVTGRLQLANVVRLAATTWADLDEAERVLKEASRIAQERKFRPPFLDADETEDTIVLHDVLLLLLCQRGEERADEATKILQQRGYTHRLSTHTLCYQKPERGPWAIDIPYVKAVDNALPASMLAHMQIAYDPAASFWSEVLGNGLLSLSTFFFLFFYFYFLAQLLASHAILFVHPSTAHNDRGADQHRPGHRLGSCDCLPPLPCRPRGDQGRVVGALPTARKWAPVAL